LAERAEVPRRGHADGENGAGYPGDRQQVLLGVIREVCPLIGMYGEAPCWGVQEDMVVVGRDEGPDRDDAVAPWPVLDDDRLAPAFLQPLREQPSTDIHSRARPQGQDELHSSLGPGLCR